MRPTKVFIDTQALLHNVGVVKQTAPGKKILAMVKANAYGCGVSSVVPVLDEHVDAFGVACLEEALALRALGSRRLCVLIQGVFGADEWHIAADQGFACVIHHVTQLQAILSTPLTTLIRVWIKVNTGMNRLGFSPKEVYSVMQAVQMCPWIRKDIGLMTHFACADEPAQVVNEQQWQCFDALSWPSGLDVRRSVANSAAMLAYPSWHVDWVRPGIMLYGVSPFSHQTGADWGLKPVMQLVSAISAIHDYPAHTKVGYGGTWQSNQPVRIGVVPVGYGDGYPRHIAPGTSVWIRGANAPIVGRVSMDMLTIDLTKACPDAQVGDAVELWGTHVPIETIAKSAGTIAYELLCQVTARARGRKHVC